jgi:hypothetical protein
MVSYGAYEPSPTPEPTPEVTPTKATSATPSPTPSPTPGPPPTPPPPASSNWSPKDENQVKAYIAQALAHSHGNVSQAFTYLRDLRDEKQNFYDTNLAIAADYMRARWDTQQHGADAEYLSVAAYLAAKRTVGVPKEGPGPTSPYSSLEEKYMLKGVTDEANKEGIWKRLAWDIPIPLQVPVTVGQIKDVLDNLRNLI